MCPVSVKVLLFGTSAVSFENNVTKSRRFMFILNKVSIFLFDHSTAPFSHKLHNSCKVLSVTFSKGLSTRLSCVI